MKAYMICDYTDKKASQIDYCPNCGVEYLGNCSGRIISEAGEVLGRHHSTTFGFLRSDLRGTVMDRDDIEIVDLIGKEIPPEIESIIKEAK